MAIGRWNDDRLDELARHVDRIAPVVTEVAVMKAEMRNLARDLRANTSATERLAGQMEKAQMEPINRWRNVRTGLVIAVGGAVAGGAVAVLSAVIASGH